MIFELPNLAVTPEDVPLVREVIFGLPDDLRVFSGFRADPTPFVVTLEPGRWVALVDGESPSADTITAYLREQIEIVRANPTPGWDA